MLQRASLLLSFLLLTSCSLYSSAGRKQFEDKAPGSIQAFSLQSCRQMSAAETWLREEFPSSTHELVEMHPDYEVWEKTLDDGHVEISVLSQENKVTEACLYKFESKEVWRIYKKSFLDELSRSLVNLD